jgi:hypothetical protein
VHAFHGVPVADQVTANDVRDSGVVVDDDDPARRVRVVSHCASSRLTARQIQGWSQLQGKSMRNGATTKQNEFVTTP